MKMINTDRRQPEPDAWCLVFVPGQTESGFDLAEFRNGFWFSQSGQMLTGEVLAWFYSDNIKIPTHVG